MNADVYASMALPDPMRGTGRLFLWPDEETTAQRVEAMVLRLGLRIDRFRAAGCIALHTNEADAVQILDNLRKYLDQASLNKTRALFKIGLEVPSLADFPHAETLTTYISYARAKWLRDMMLERHVTAWFQPIVDAQNPEQVVAWEALARGRAKSPHSEVVLPSRLMSAARDAGLLTSFDVHIHKMALEVFDLPVDSNAGLFLNITPCTLEDPSFNLTHLHQAALKSGIHPTRITLEIIESETIVDMDQIQNRLTVARALGFGLALDDLGAGYSNLNLIHQLRPDIVKLDMGLTRNIHADEYKAVIAQKILEATDRLGVRTVAEGIESEEELDWLAQHGVNLVQGFLIARPTPSPRLIPLPSLSVPG